MDEETKKWFIQEVRSSVCSVLPDFIKTVEHGVDDNTLEPEIVVRIRLPEATCKTPKQYWESGGISYQTLPTPEYSKTISEDERKAADLLLRY